MMYFYHKKVKDDIMIRTQIQLTEMQYRLLKNLSIEKNKSMAEIIRECITYYSAGKCLTSKEEKYSKAISAMGKFKSGKKDISINHDKYLTEDFKK